MGLKDRRELKVDLKLRVPLKLSEYNFHFYRQSDSESYGHVSLRGFLTNLKYTRSVFVYKSEETDVYNSNFQTLSKHKNTKN